MSLKNRCEAVGFFEVINGNPNGNPDAGNMPRIDPQTGYGFVTDVKIKRGIRDYVELTKDGEPGFNILIKADQALNSKFTAAYEAEGLATGKKGKNKEDVRKAKEYMTRNYYDARCFGAVMDTGDDRCGKVQGPVQVSFSQSQSPIYTMPVTITRKAKTTVPRLEESETEMAQKYIVPYALYRVEIFVSAALANRTTGMSEEDVELLWEALTHMFENQHSASNGEMNMRKLYVFKHASELGCCPSHVLFDKISVCEKEGIKVPRKFSDYDITVDRNMPDGVELIEKL